VLVTTAQTGAAAHPVALFVLGMHRSGTSALTRALSLCGGALPTELFGPDAGNPRGYWESRAAVDLNDAILRRHGRTWYDPSLRLQEEGAFNADEKAACIAEIGEFLTTLPAAPLVIIKDPRITLLSGMWFEAARLAGFDIAAVIAVRHPQEVIASLAKRSPASPEHLSALWLKYSLLTERHTRALPRVFVEYANLLDNWRQEITRISTALPIDLDTRDEGAIDEFLQQDLHRQRHRGPVTEPFGTDWISVVYETQCAAAREEPWDTSLLDRVFDAYRAGEHDFQTAFEDCRDHDHLNPGDVRSAKVENFAQARVFYLAQSYFDQGDFAEARKWYAHRLEMGGWDQEVYYAMYRIAESMAKLDAPWPDVQDAYLRAWEFRPTRAEPLHAIAQRYCADHRYRLGHLFAEAAAEIPVPEHDTLLVETDVYAWRATDEQAVCASGIGKHAEAFTRCRRLLARPDIPDGDRQRIARNRDFSVPAMIENASTYPEALVGNLTAGPHDAEVTVTVIAGPDHSTTEHTLNSFLHCCTDLSKIGRFLVFDAGLSAQDRETLHQRYGFLEFADPGPGGGPGAQLAPTRSRFWLHLGGGWRFFTPENFITRLTAVLDTETQVFQVGINFTDAAKLTSTCAAEQTVRRAPGAGRYVLTDVVASGPAMFDTTRLNQAGDANGTDTVPTIADLGGRAAAAGLQTATLDEVLCITAI